MARRYGIRHGEKLVLGRKQIRHVIEEFDRQRKELVRAMDKGGVVVVEKGGTLFWWGRTVVAPAGWADNSTALTSNLADQIGIGAEDNHAYLGEELQSSEEDLVPGTVMRIKNRCKMLGPSAYPFNLDQSGEILTCNTKLHRVGMM